jgi:O-antigen/teichoic acid export membrane protein
VSEDVTGLGADALARPEVRLGAGTAWGLSGQVIGLGTSFLIGVLIARLLGVEGKGVLSVVMQVISIALVVLNLGVAGANVYYVAKGRVAPGTAVGNSALLAAMLGLVGAPVVVALLTGRLAVVPGVAAGTVVFAVLAVPLGLFSGSLIGVSSGLGDLRLGFLFALSSSVTTLAALGGLLLFVRVTVPAVVATSVLGTAVGIVIVLIGLRGPLHGGVRVDLASAKEMAGYSAKTHLAGVAGYLHNRQDVLILGWLAGAGAVGLYSVGVAFAELLWYVPSALGAAILAKAPRDSDASTHDYVARSTRISVLFMLVITLVAIPTVPFVIRLVYGSAFGPSALAFFVLLPGALADGVMRPAWSYFAARERIFWREATGTMLLNIVLNLVLVPRMGFAGAALASSVSYVALASIVVVSFIRSTGAQLASLVVPTTADASIALRTLARMSRGITGPTRGA